MSDKPKPERKQRCDVVPSASTNSELAALRSELEEVKGERDILDKLAENRAKKLADSERMAEELAKGLGGCFVDLGGLLIATTWELAPGVRAQLQKSHDKAEALLARWRAGKERKA